MDRNALERLAVAGYFEQLNAHNLEGVMAGIAEDCEMRIPSSGFTYSGKAALQAHLSDFLKIFRTVNFRDYIVVVDAATRRVAVRFNVSLTDDAGEETHMANCNFFEVSAAGQLTDILIYASSPLSKGFQAGSS